MTFANNNTRYSLIFGVFILGSMFSLSTEPRVIVIPFDDLVIAVDTPELEHVVHVSIDALYGGAIGELGADRLPTIYKLISEGSSTTSAESDDDFTSTLPNHVSQFTGLTVANHGWTSNSYIPGQSLSVGESAFSAIKQAGFLTSLFAQKEKFALFPASWPASIDKYVYNSEAAPLMQSFITDLGSRRPNYAFIHLAPPDTSGHSNNFDFELDSPYYNAIESIDDLLFLLVDFIEKDQYLSRRTTLILTSDHGAADGLNVHDDSLIESNHRVPFIVWGLTVSKGTNIRALNPNISVSNRHAGLLAESLLGLQVDSADRLSSW